MTPRKKSGKSGKLKAVREKSRVSVPSPTPPVFEGLEPLPSHSPKAWDRFLFAALMLAGGFAWLRHSADIGLVLLVCAGLLGFSFFVRLKKMSHVLLILGFGWLLTVAALGCLPNFKYAFLPWVDFSFPNPLFHFAVGLGLLLAFWRFLPPVDLSKDISIPFGDRKSVV